MKYLKTFENYLKYKVNDIAGYDKYIDSPFIPVRVLAVVPTSKYPYFVETIEQDATYILQEDDVVDLTPEQIEKVKLKIATDKYNL